jgi:hypothetical protein
MKYVNVVNVAPSSAVAEFFEENAFGGKKTELARGDHAASKVGKPKSLKLAKFTEVMFYEKADGSGKSATFREDAGELKLDFSPALITVGSYAEGFKGGKSAGILSEGDYKPEEIKKYDSVKVPRGVYLAWMGNEKDENQIYLFENGECKVDGRFDSYKKAAVFSLGGADVRLNFRISEELSEDDLAAVAGGGKCGAEAGACGADACGIAF